MDNLFDLSFDFTHDSYYFLFRNVSQDSKRVFRLRQPPKPSEAGFDRPGKKSSEVNMPFLTTFLLKIGEKSGKDYCKVLDR